MTSRPAAPELETPETDALVKSLAVGEGSTWTKAEMRLAKHARSLERRLSLAQTEIKGHMRVIHELGEAVRRAQADERHATYQYSEAQARIAILEEELRRSKNAPA